MAYDPIKAHEYYEKYRKKGQLKGRGKAKSKAKGKAKGKAKKGKAKTAKQPKIKKETLIGFGMSGLNGAGKMEWRAQKLQMQEQMNKELQAATTEDEKAGIREKFQTQAEEIREMMNHDARYAQPKKEKAKKLVAKLKSKIKTLSDADKAKVKAKIELVVKKYRAGR